MTSPTLPAIDEIYVFHLESMLWVASRDIGLSNYDYRFAPHFDCRTG
jgi:hypothetical protein